MTDSVMDKGKTMAPRAHSTLNHPEVNQRRATQFFPLLASTKLASHTFYSLAYLARISYLLRHSVQKFTFRPCRANWCFTHQWQQQSAAQHLCWSSIKHAVCVTWASIIMDATCQTSVIWTFSYMNISVNQTLWSQISDFLLYRGLLGLGILQL